MGRFQRLYPRLPLNMKVTWLRKHLINFQKNALAYHYLSPAIAFYF